MNMLEHIIRSVGRWISDWFIPPYQTQIVEDELPKTLTRRVIYIVQEDGYVEQAAMLCPCGCGRTLNMNLIPDERPCWRLQKHTNGTASLSPSIWKKKDCRSHFWFKKGRVRWCRDMS